MAHSEDVKLEASSPREMTLYSRPGCHLCEEAKQQIAPLLREFALTLREVNIESDPALEARHGSDIPVLFLGLRKIAKHQVDVRQLRRLLQETISK